MPTHLKGWGGPDLPLGLIVVDAPGTKKRLTALIDPTDTYAPGGSSERLSPAFQQIMIQGMKDGGLGGDRLVDNTGNIYVVRSDDDAGVDGIDGTVVAVIKPGQTVWLSAAPMAKNVLSPYRYYLDADNAGDSGLAVGYIF